MPTALTPLRWQAFHLPKRGNSEEEYEDAFAGSAERGRFAVADGASESSFAGIWAQLLAKGFVHEAQRPWKETGWLEPIRARWVTEVGRRPLPWYAEMKREQGAFATLLGLALRRPNHWRAVAIGDSCVMQVRDGRLAVSFPMRHAEDFGNQPALVPSRVIGGGRQPTLRLFNGLWKPGDCFLLMTDALAQWFLAEFEEERRPWERLIPLLRDTGAMDTFAALVAEAREHGAMRNDDVTLVLVDTTAPPATKKE
jgi:serine/threonine protein phosphatase PrpC